MSCQSALLCALQHGVSERRAGIHDQITARSIFVAYHQRLTGKLRRPVVWKCDEYENCLGRAKYAFAEFAIATHHMHGLKLRTGAKDQKHLRARAGSSGFANIYRALVG